MADQRLPDLLSEWACGAVPAPRRKPVRLDPEQRRLLLRLARGEEPESVPGERVRALSWLSRLEEDRDEAVSALLAVVSSGAPIDARVQAVRTLSRMKDPASERALGRLAQAAGEHPAITLAAARGLASRRP
jgi:hypothetical protein